MGLTVVKRSALNLCGVISFKNLEKRMRKIDLGCVAVGQHLHFLKQHVFALFDSSAW